MRENNEFEKEFIKSIKFDEQKRWKKKRHQGLLYSATQADGVLFSKIMKNKGEQMCVRGEGEAE